MKNRNFFLLLVIICIFAPAVHYFIAGKDQEHSTIRNVLVVVQIAAGVLLLFLFGRNPGKRNTNS